MKFLTTAGQVALAAALLVGLTAPLLAQPQVPESRAEITLSYAPVVKKAAPAVVNVYASRVVRQPGFSLFEQDPFFRRFFGPGFGVPRERVQSSLGSGVIVSPDGVVVTNNHVITGATDIKIALADRREFEAEVILKDEQTDLAVLRAVDAREPFPYLELGDSDALEVGDLVLAIGNPFGVGQTVTSGIVSAVARTRVGVSDYQFFIQTDAAINPGNSGGALVAMDGRVVGINSAIFTRTGGSLGIGFAIPSNMVRVVIESAHDGGRVRRPWVGASLQTVSADIAESIGLARPGGALVSEVYPGGPAAAAGLRSGDVILAVDDHEVADVEGFGFRLATRGIGGTARLKVLRNGRALNLEVALKPPPEVPPRNETLLSGTNPLSGATVVNVSPAVADELRLGLQASGVAVSSVEQGTPADNVGLKRGDVIREINGIGISSVRQIKSAVEARARRWRLVIQRGDRVLSVVLG
ncbi:MAG: DegQ family serine endoprotease [Hyphomicrobiales bacterium]|nr:DegQ family serine endoprotease [Hyphomicrobiales bacterium]